MVIVPDAASFIHMLPFYLHSFYGFCVCAVFLTMKGFSWYPTSCLPRVALLLMPVWVFQVYTAFGTVIVEKKSGKSPNLAHTVGCTLVFIVGKLLCYFVSGFTLNFDSSCEERQLCLMLPPFLYSIKALLLAACHALCHLTAVNKLYISQLSKHSTLNDSPECVLLSE